MGLGVRFFINSVRRRQLAAVGDSSTFEFLKFPPLRKVSHLPRVVTRVVSLSQSCGAERGAKSRVEKLALSSDSCLQLAIAVAYSCHLQLPRLLPTVGTDSWALVYDSWRQLATVATIVAYSCHDCCLQLATIVGGLEIVAYSWRRLLPTVATMVAYSWRRLSPPVATIVAYSCHDCCDD